MISIAAVGGYSEVGRNMTAVRYKDEVIILDMGVHLENYIKIKGDDDLEIISAKELINAGAVPDDSTIKDWRRNVVAIIPSHAHLDHVGAIPYMASKYDAPIICTPYTAAVIQAIVKDKKTALENQIKVLKSGNKIKISDSMTIEFVNVTHSVPDTAIVVIHTPKGQVVYANDFKFDNTPIIGQKPDYERLEKLGKEGHVTALILDSLYAHVPMKTPSEAIAREMLKDVMLNINSEGKAVIVTTFSSHIARLKSIIEFGKIMKRKTVFLGRSLAKYVYAAEDIGLVNFSKKIEIVPYKSQVGKKLKKIEKEGRGKYLIVATGHQGEPDSVLSRIVNGKLGFRLLPEDLLIFSCNIIPSPMNIENRSTLEAKLQEYKIRIFKDIHQSGHAFREDHREIIKMLKPKHIVPAHSPPSKTMFMAELAKEMGYTLEKTVHIMENGRIIELT